MKKLIHASEVLTGDGVRRHSGRRPQESHLGRIPDGAIVYDENKIHWVGPTASIPAEYRDAETQDLRGEQAVIPGLIDCHTHLVFGGDRSTEFAERCGGVSYEEIAARGGGILTTVNGTREASLDELEALAIPRLQEFLAYGVKTLEIKSGYGLTKESELKTLEVVQRLVKRFPEVTIKATFLGAHAFPKEKTREAYLDEIINEMLPEVAERKLADACDVFVDRGYFTIDEARKILGRAKDLGLDLKLHGDELANTESAALAVELGALSVDHLLQVSDQGVAALGNSETVAVLLPGTAFYLKADYAPARKLIDAGAIVALSTDFNPGSSMMISLPVVMTLGALYMGMTRAEVFASVTYNAAKALGLEAKKGTLEVGMDPDFTVLPFRRFEEAYYRFAWAPRS